MNYASTDVAHVNTLRAENATAALSNSEKGKVVKLDRSKFCH